VNAHVVDISGLDADEAGVVREYRWWTPDELQTSTERFSPVRLQQLLAPLLEGHLPAEPIAIGD
jgi:8-oxo-dGTP diphosphatase